jgi:hypothetical protein
MKMLRAVVLALIVGAGGLVVAGCASASEATTSYKCAMTSCTKTKDAKASDPAPS